MMDVDKSLGLVGSFGKKQCINYLIYCIVLMSSAWHLLSVSFTVGEPEGYSCRIPLNVTPGEYVSSDDGCHLLRRVIDGNTTTTEDNTTVSSSCLDGWEYESLHGETSIVTEFDLICDDAIIGSTLVSIHFAGCLVGSSVTGQISDIFGRRTAVLVSLIGVVLTGVGMSFSQSYALIATLKFFNGCFIPALLIVTYVRTIEMFPPGLRVRSHFGSGLFWVSGLVMVAPLAYIMPDWRQFQLITSLMYIPFIPLVWYSYESIRWLVQMGRIDEAEVILKTLAKSKDIQYSRFPIHDLEDTEERRTVLPKEEEAAGPAPSKEGGDEGDEMQEVCVKETKSTRKYTLLDLFRTRALIAPTLIIFYCWCTCSVVYYGLLLQATNLVGNKYLNFSLLSLVELPCYAVNFIITTRYGRRRPLVLDFLFGGVASIVTGFLPLETAGGTSLVVLQFAIVIFGRFCVAMSFDLVYLVTMEVFPTVLRNVGAGSASMVGRVGGMVAPFIVFLNVYHGSIPFVVFGVMSVVAGLLIVPLPETNNRSLPETLDDGEKLAKMEVPAKKNCEMGKSSSPSVMTMLTAREKSELASES
ncbi:organic cation transporter protein-like [Asterias amurensis]|uniref:organic cation transporter protein-like n=1 Tax=Asterias amurensis TaxID=7602 RepID=UPI003AB43DA3